jgi:hypothetical protein
MADCGRDHAEPVSHHGLSADPYGKAYRKKEEDIGIGRKEVKEGLHGVLLSAVP